MGFRERIFGRKDVASRRVVALIECHLNQNARDPGAARYPAVNDSLLEALRKHDAGLLQIPCPEMFCLGLPRTRPPGTSIRQNLDPGKARYLAVQVADRIEEYERNGMRVVGILGGDVSSPGCAVHPTESGLDPERSGIFMLELHGVLASRGLEIPFRGIRESDPEAFAEDLAWVERALGS